MFMSYFFPTKFRWHCICHLILFIFFLNFSANAANYYVNSRFGNDDNIGTTKETAWKSLKNLSNKFLPGDNILFLLATLCKNLRPPRLTTFA